MSSGKHNPPEGHFGVQSCFLDSFIQNIENVNFDSFNDEGERMQALSATQALLARLESPWDTTVRLNMTQPALGAALKTVNDLQLFQKWHEHGNGSLTSTQAAEIVGGKCDARLLYRLLRLMAANHIVKEGPLGTLQPTQFSMSITAPVFHGLFNSYYNLILPIYAHLPRFFEKTGYANPEDPRATAFQFAHGWEGDLWSYYTAHPDEQDEFNTIQKTIASQQPVWTDIFPIETLLDAEPGTPLVVDVGGGTGHDLIVFHQTDPKVASQLYLEDLESVIEKAPMPTGINKVAYDFFTPQPVKGARAYLMHSILHDWPDELARKILAAQKEAMTPGYSRLLLHEHIDNEGPANPQTAAFDIQMMVLVGGRERSEKDWRELLESAGFVVIKIWKLPSATQSIIEAEVPV
ncbi:o-methyltransferase [Colletotrichum truncatum]|uniref:O-methyltransferase n=1 Tax=Colletotrichum truncatum TaxID=5467 RepID=A0ACC3Z2Y1_COLTU|nr:o-methyltransferase [Colletotrichum truncatum]KAF6793255.1 o-methyltransferase [Colletotrichum truncatum]